MNVPSALDVDAAGNLFIVDGANHRVRRVTTDGIMSTLVGDGDQANAGDGGPAREAPSPSRPTLPSTLKATS